MAGFFEKIGDAFEEAGTEIVDFYKGLGKEIWHDLNEKIYHSTLETQGIAMMSPYHSPLEIQGFAMRNAMKPVRQYKKKKPSLVEIQGIAMREAMKPVRHYKEESPYAKKNDDAFLRGNKAYIKESVWRPSTYDIAECVVDDEYEGIKSEFEVQNGKPTKKTNINPPSTDILYEQPVKTSNGYWGEPTGSIALVDNPNNQLSSFLKFMANNN